MRIPFMKNLRIKWKKRSNPGCSFSGPYFGQLIHKGIVCSRRPRLMKIYKSDGKHWLTSKICAECTEFPQ